MANDAAPIQVDPLRDSASKATATLRALESKNGAAIDGAAVMLGGVGVEALALLRIMSDAVRARMARPVSRFGVQKWAIPVAVKRVKGHEAEIVTEAHAVYENGVRGIREFVRERGGDAERDGTFSVDFDGGVASELPREHQYAGCPQGMLVLTWTPHDAAPEAEKPVVVAP